MILILLQAKAHFTKLIKNLRDIRNVNIGICSGLYINKNDQINSEFQKEAEKVFGISVKKIDFSKPKNAVDEINEWVRFHTIHEVIKFLTGGAYGQQCRKIYAI